jgi:hypothetical protein
MVLFSVGDHIIKIDNIDTSKMDSKTLSVLLQICRFEKKRTVQIVVARRAEKGARCALAESTNSQSLPLCDIHPVRATNSEAVVDD